MPRSRFFGFGRVNLIKKVKVDGEWKFCPAVVEPGRKLNDLVRVNGKVETHSEGTYYLEWREQGQRRRQPVHNRAVVFEQARLKGLELEAERKPAEIASLPESPLPFPVNAASLAPTVVAHRFPAVATLPNLVAQFLRFLLDCPPGDQNCGQATSLLLNGRSGRLNLWVPK